MSGRDGAHAGISAGRALGTILGGEPAPAGPAPERENARVWIMAAAEPMAESGPCSGLEDSRYSDAANTIAKAMLLACTPEQIADRNADLYAIVEARWPGFDSWLGGATGFMVGWATNTVRWLSELPPVPNPALITVGDEPARGDS